MTTITEDYCSFEVAMLLKEKGFNEVVHAYHNIYDKVNLDFNVSVEAPHLQIPCPTHQMAMKWLRQAHGIHIYIELGVREDKPDKYVNFWRPVIQGMFNTKHFRDINEKAKQHFAWKFYDEFEKATDDAIMFTLKNLV